MKDFCVVDEDDANIVLLLTVKAVVEPTLEVDIFLKVFF
jgi:hypothetical protein